MSLVGILVALIIIGLIYWCVMRLLAAFGFGEPVTTVAQVIFVIIVLLWLLNAVFGVGPSLRLH